MRKRLKAFTLIELLVVIAIIALLISILLPSLSRARELSKRLVCAANSKGIGTSAKIYANDNNERWMIPGFSVKTVETGTGIDYLNNDDSISKPSTDPGEVAYDREFESTADSSSGQEGSPAVSVTRAYWMMVRSGDITVAQFICPSSGDSTDDTENLDLYYDFQEYTNVSYGYQVPFGPRDTQPREGSDNRQILAADKGPYYTPSQGNPDFQGAGSPPPIDPSDSPRAWRQFNSPNHGGRNNGEGQNCLFADGHAAFTRTPAVGIDSDNIYTVMTDEWSVLGENRYHGDSPHISSADNPYPGKEAFGQGNNQYSSTDSLIYP